MFEVVNDECPTLSDHVSTPLEIFPAYPKVVSRVSRQRVEDNTGETARFPTLALSPFDVLPELSQARQWGQASPLPSILGQLRSILLGYHHRKRLPIIADGTHGFYEFLRGIVFGTRPLESLQRLVIRNV